MDGIKVDITGTDELINALEKAGKQFPATTERVLKKEARNVAKDLASRTSREAKGHHYGGSKNPLADSYRQGRVIKSGKEYTVAVTSKAPHYHLYEEGHDLYTHNKKNKRGKGKIGSGKKIGHVKGRKTVARYMAQRSEYSEVIGQELLNEILKETGLDT